MCSALRSASGELISEDCVPLRNQDRVQTMKRIWAVGKSEDVDAVCGIFRSVNAEIEAFPNLDSLMGAGTQYIPHLIIVIFELAAKSDSAAQDIRSHFQLKTVPILGCYPAFTAKAEMRGRLSGANEILLLPVSRYELLSKSAALLQIDKRRNFRTMLTVEGAGRSVIAQSQDFSTAGISFLADRTLHENEAVIIHLFLPSNGGRLQLNAVIARKSAMADGEFYYGARFTENDSALLAKISEFIDRGR